MPSPTWLRQPLAQVTLRGSTDGEIATMRVISDVAEIPEARKPVSKTRRYRRRTVRGVSGRLADELDLRGVPEAKWVAPGCYAASMRPQR